MYGKQPAGLHNQGEKSDRFFFLIIAAAGLGALIMMFDLALPLGVAGGVPYVSLVMLGMWYPKRHHILYLACVGTAMTLLGYYYSPHGGEVWIVVTNRLLAVFAIWVTAALAFRFKGIVLENRKLARAIEQSPVGVVLTDTDGVIEYVNPKMLEVSGYSADELIGKKTRIFASGQTPQKTYEELWEKILKGEDWGGEMINRTRSGDFYWEQVYISTIFDRQGEIRNFVAFKEDVSARKRAEDELVAARQEAEYASNIKSNFLANMSHELRTPLNAILGFSESIKMQMLGPINNSKYLEYANDIYNSAFHLSNMINDILDLSKLESSPLEIHEGKINLYEVSRFCVSLVREIAEGGDIELIDETHDTLPVLLADERMIKQVMLNLLSNAIKQTPEGGVIKVRAHPQDDGKLVIDVADNGVVTSAKEPLLSFDSIGQVGLEYGLASQAQEAQLGQGLGLSLSHKFMKMHDGDLEIKSTQGVGTTVTAWFPARRVLNSPGTGANLEVS